ncbi:uncharacterized protein LOC134822966 isoform X2 [Bolinopsis microptera]|uniref:uncharacterized protein LOC134822966 isoform X2 n=1 Tax=Bolinopsis microptera TaxID=2820187 RepID=UPI00307A37E0
MVSETAPWTTTTSSSTPPFPTLDLHTNTKWALVGFLVFSPISSAIFLTIYIRMDRKKTNILNIQLAVINLLSSVVLLPMFFTFYQLFSMTGDSFAESWKEEFVNKTFCGSLAMTFYVLTSLHYTTLFALSLDRMVAVYFPFTYRRLANVHYICGQAILWVLTLTLPLLGFFDTGSTMPVGKSFKDSKNNQTVPRRLFQYLPNSIMDHQNVFCEITFQRMTVDDKGVPLHYEPDGKMKVYCFFMMVVPFVVVPLMTVIVGVFTMSKIGTLDFKRKSLKYGNNKGSFSGRLGFIFRNQKNITEIDEMEMVYENKNHQNTGSERANDSLTTDLNKLPSKRRINSHIQALTTVVMLMVLFCLCDSLWWIINVFYALKYIFNKSILNISGMFASSEQQVIFPIVARFGIFVYGTLVPFLMIWRQKPLRDEFMSMFRNAKSRFHYEPESEFQRSVCEITTSTVSFNFTTLVETGPEPFRCRVSSYQRIS